MNALRSLMMRSRFWHVTSGVVLSRMAWTAKRFKVCDFIIRPISINVMNVEIFRYTALFASQLNELPGAIVVCRSANFFLPVFHDRITTTIIDVSSSVLFTGLSIGLDLWTGAA